MTWEEKSLMCQKFNSYSFDDNKEHLKEALQLVLEKKNEMDEQAWDMFFTAMPMLKEVIDLHLDMHKQIYEFSKDMKSGSFRTAIRMAAYEMLIKREE